MTLPQLQYFWPDDADHFRQHRRRGWNMLEEPLTAARIKRVRLEGERSTLALATLSRQLKRASQVDSLPSHSGWQ